ncbi:hypothetical protein HZH68_001506 [Vespula germanica]|uniref:Uncharacterized protein n=1 Tax=Vespula germanica TaxID=30212 RepID=A0A834NVL0_VESGE|nr:hypothetical protein HZH68_001506 [Vespula germanica]
MPSSIRVDHNNRRINAANLQSRLANGRSLDAALRLPAVGPRGCGRTKDSAEKEPTEFEGSLIPSAIVRACGGGTERHSIAGLHLRFSIMETQRSPGPPSVSSCYSLFSSTSFYDDDDDDDDDDDNRIYYPPIRWYQPSLALPLVILDNWKTKS